MLAIVFPVINPVFLEIGTIELRWYGLAYALGLICAYIWLRIIYGKDSLLADDIFTYSTIGIIVGGRLGYCIFYHFNWLWKDPWRIFKIMEGGMSFHGGLIGVIFALYYASHKHKESFLSVCDNVSCIAPIGILFGRIANFINSELWGRVTNIAWGILLPNGVVRHPSQIYEGLMEGLILFCIMMLSYNKFASKKGVLSGIFLVLYGIFRMILEVFREPDTHIGFYFGFITNGQLLSIPMIMLGVFLILRYKLSYDGKLPK